MNNVSILAAIPFLLMLAAIAVFPIFVPHFWEKNRNKLMIAVILAIPTIIYMFRMDMLSAIFHSIVFDYIPFIVLLGALFIITGGIFMDVKGGATPLANSVLLGSGTLLASFIGTTGAAMLMINPLLHMNRQREFKTHTILFFIALVCNCGGLLTPLGDPPLFMMYLRGASFTWFFKLYPEWLIVNIVLMIIYLIMEMRFWKKEKAEIRQECLSKSTS